MFKLGQCAEKKWRRLHGFDYLAKVITGVKFKDGRFQRHTNALILTMSGAILEDASVMKMGDLVDDKLRE